MNNQNKKFRLIHLPEESSHEEVNQFNEQMDNLIKTNGMPIIVNCENIEMVYSSGLGILIDAYKKCNKEKVLFAVVNVNSAILSTINSTRLNKVINVFPTLEEYEISEFEDGLVGTKVPPLDFSYEEANLKGHKLFTCKGVMCEGPTMNQLLNSLRGLNAVVFNLLPSV